MHHPIMNHGHVLLPDKQRFPAIGFGTYQLGNRDETAAAVREAIAAGYRLIDTAEDYHNEEGVGQGIRMSAAPREDIVVSSKVWPANLGYDKTMRAFDRSLRRLGLDYLDLYLIHWPCSAEANAGSWKALEKLQQQGLVKRIGVSNFTIRQLTDLLSGAMAQPFVNQIEFHPGFVDTDLVEFCFSRGILVEAWSPLMQGRAVTDDTLRRIAGRHGRSVAQVVLRWCVQRGVIPVPKTGTPARMRENISIFDFHLDEAEMDAIRALQTGKRLGPDPESYQFCPTDC